MGQTRPPEQGRVVSSADTGRQRDRFTHFLFKARVMSGQVARLTWISVGCSYLSSASPASRCGGTCSTSQLETSVPDASITAAGSTVAGSTAPHDAGSACVGRASAAFFRRFFFGGSRLETVSAFSFAFFFRFFFGGSVRLVSSLSEVSAVVFVSASLSILCNFFVLSFADFLVAFSDVAWP